MSKKDKYSLPASGAGLVRYFDEESTGPKVSPEQIVAITIILAIICMALKFSNTTGSS
ncbi:MAG: preprotein translocase subunit Sec61beta [Methanobrevibacter sp.]|jgi:preprotein translocase subunit Sec61beta|nr:preprotein translocase subunit Sec61beta [Methanobrevibacter sp.]